MSKSKYFVNEKIQKQNKNRKTKEKIDEYNKNPNMCIYCNMPILATYDKRLFDIKRKKFCSHSCAAKYNKIGNIMNFYNKNNDYKTIVDSLSDEEIIIAFNSSNNLSEFSKKLGYKAKIHIDSKLINERLNKLHLDITSLKNNDEISVNNLTKKDIFDRYKQWQTARSMIQKKARSIYKNSSKPKKCICCGYDKHYEVAHIKAVSLFDDNALISEINDENNLIALCPNHHWEYDNTNFDITPFLNGVI